ncbi:MAG: UbiA prenyltransferase family protein [Candidatus Shapirobacteria bacterium]|nr:UbiA prenyltransferase family protein [Candidatus Shapirobacteria bacterium]
MFHLRALIISLRPYQWVKNLAVYSAILFTGHLFDENYFLITTAGFIIFCLLSSASYLLNDIIDIPHDRLHPAKKSRPVASGKLPVDTAFQVSVGLFIFGLAAAFLISRGFFLISLVFVLLHLAYSLFLKKHPPLDILAIATSFVLRTFAGETLTGFHIPIWLVFSVIFLSLFIASGKRRSELIKEGRETRPALKLYRQELLNSYLSIFGTATLISYALFTFSASPPDFSDKLFRFLLANYPKTIDRKWLMISVPFVITGLMRYAQLVFLVQDGEVPERTIKDPYLILSLLGWGAAIFAIIYVF